MCDTLVYATHDVTPEFWADFAFTASRVLDEPVEEVCIAYALVASPTQDQFERTPKIDTTISTGLGAASWEEIKALHAKICKQKPPNIDKIVFLILDQQSIKDRTVVVMEKVKDRNSEDGKDAEGNNVKVDMTVYSKYRVPFEHANLVEAALDGCVNPEEIDKYFVEVERVAASESESEDDAESDSTDEEDIDRKWEYMS